MALQTRRRKGGSRKKRMKKIVQVKSRKDAAKVEKSKYIFYRFKMDGCGHCVESQGDWNEMCKIVETTLNTDCILAEIEQKMLGFFNLGPKPSMFPTHLIIKNGKQVEEVSDRSVAGMVKALKKHKFV
jgi:hypothetical protein